ncbi:ComEC/Rec2 family competence protein [Pyxidicoccus xibeiensis]|uniref:ComEC/Rec2 family competence protein n=1 Tax=Pyxidicoccus xibeiensis TaxID=2906759 RepID=UPI0020A82AF1|nr:MBL fold metallo-hydrolase [Pyxidicoccus xibeiensis]MCP3144055.1 MBL fold metallo-hydrolase [Pyxidicoccus xibeiensis]
MSPRLFSILGVLLAVVACKEPPPPGAAEPRQPAEPQQRRAEPRRYFGGAPDGKLHVYFFNVGQGDAALIVSPEGHTVLVDSGPASAADHLVNRLPELLTQRLDLVVLTHPHEDHHGALEPVLRRVGARQLLEPRVGDTPPEYDALLATLGEQGMEILSPSPPPSTPNAPLRLSLGTGVELTVLWPRPPEERLEVPGAVVEANSIVLRLTYGDTAVLFTGDAHARTEAHLLSLGAPLKATLLKVAAHGAEGPTTDAFLKAVEPRAAVISVGPDNTRGAPAPGTVKRLQAKGAQVFRTDVEGEVQVVGDGKTLVITPQRLPAGVPEDTRYTFAGLSSGGAVANAASATGPEGDVPLAKPSKPPASKTQTSRTGSGGRDSTDLSRYGQVVDIDALPSSDTPPRPRPEARPPRGGTQPGAMSAGGYIGSSRTDVFHLPSCSSAKRIKRENRVTFPTRDEAISQRRRPAKDCNP